jgi:hypothetical protein
MLGVVTHFCNPSYSRGKELEEHGLGWIGQELQTLLEKITQTERLVEWLK